MPLHIISPLIIIMALFCASCKKQQPIIEPTSKSFSTSYDNYKIWSSPSDPIAHSGYSIALNENDNTYLYWNSNDMMIHGSEEMYPKKGFYHESVNGEITLETVLGDKTILQKVDLDGTAAYAIKGIELEKAIRKGLVLLERNHGRIDSPWGQTEETSFEKQRIAEIIKSRRNKSNETQ